MVGRRRFSIEIGDWFEKSASLRKERGVPLCCSPVVLRRGGREIGRERGEKSKKDEPSRRSI